MYEVRKQRRVFQFGVGNDVFEVPALDSVNVETAYKLAEISDSPESVMSWAREFFEDSAPGCLSDVTPREFMGLFEEWMKTGNAGK